jgi:hypothetical protein
MVGTTRAPVQLLICSKMVQNSYSCQPSHRRPTLATAQLNTVGIIVKHWLNQSAPHLQWYSQVVLCLDVEQLGMPLLIVGVTARAQCFKIVATIIKNCARSTV